MSSAVYGVVVTYNPDDDVSDVVASAAAQCETLLVVDNHSNSEGLARVRNAAAQHANVDVLENARNLGVAAGLNFGIAAAFVSGATWLLTLDQDTLLPPVAVADMLAALGNCPASDSVGIVAPRYQYRGKKRRRDEAQETPHAECRYLDAVITSANLVRMDAVRAVGPFAKEFFVDYVDYEFCLRLRRGGWRIVEASNVVAEHAMGEVRDGSLVGWPVRFTHYSPLRRYYKARNQVLTYRRHGIAYPKWVARDLCRLVWDLAKGFLLEDEPRVATVSALCGIRDALIGRTGPRLDSAS